MSALRYYNFVIPGADITYPEPNIGTNIGYSYYTAKLVLLDPAGHPEQDIREDV